MSESSEKKNRSFLRGEFKDQIKDAAEKLVDESIQMKFKEKDKLIFHIAMQRDVSFLVACALGIATIALSILLYVGQTWK